MRKKNSLKFKKILSDLFYLTIIVVLFGIFLSLFVFVYFAKDLPRPERYTDRPIVEPSKIYDRAGENILYTIYGEEKREIIDIDSVSPYFIDALLTAEDRNFYDHIGIDFQGIIRSVLLNLQARKTVAGGSTISQQFVRSALLTPERKTIRKVREIVLTLELERRYSKDEILGFYLNQIPFGSNAYGIESAAKTYFNKRANELTLAESATLVSLIPAPTYFSPYGDNRDELIRRKDLLLDAMFSIGSITEEELIEAKEEILDFHISKDYLRAPHFVMYIKGMLEEEYGEDFLQEEGLKIYTTIDFELQKKAEEIVKKRVLNNYNYNAYNAALIAINPKNGDILAMVGSANYFGDPIPENCSPGVNCKFDPFTNITTQQRQPGSAFKPFVYAIAFENGYSGETTVIDEQTNFGTASNPYIPRNYDGQFRGEVTLRESLAQSLNVPSVKVLKKFSGLRESVKRANDYGINLSHSADFYGLPFALGSSDVKLLEMAVGYGVFAAEGYRNNPISILKIEDKDGNIIKENKNTPSLVLQPRVAREITDILSDNEARAPIFGWNSNLYFPLHPVAVKTGSTQNFRDGWCVGYTDSIVVGVWAGNNDNSPMYNAAGVTVAAPIWREFIEFTL